MVASKHCTGCEACANCCPVSAIQMSADEEGFLYPLVDNEKCVHCGLCDQVCTAVFSKRPLILNDREWMFSADEEKLRCNSSSGGAFTMLAREVLEKGGLVVGCRMDADCYGASHIGVTGEEEISALRGSKYIQSRIGDTFCLTKSALAEGKWVLFVGTPCQVAGLQGYLGNSPQDRLLTVDLICHGVPSPMVWRAYAEEMEKEESAKLTQVSFRNKESGWRIYSLKCVFTNGTVRSQTVLKDLYLRGFVENLYLRPCCHDCLFKGDNYKSDITLGDFWGAESSFPELVGREGVSLAITHTEKGEMAMKELSSGGALREVTGMNALKHNSAFYRGVTPSPFRGRVLSQVGKKSMQKVLRKYCGFSLGAKMRKKIAKARTR